MSDLVASETPPFASRPDQAPAAEVSGPAALAGRCAAALTLVAGATLIAFVAENVITAPNLTLIYVLPVVITAAAFGSVPAIVASVGSVLAFDFFFTEPYFSLRISSPSDIWG